jgi:hypothetical protein
MAFPTTTILDSTSTPVTVNTLPNAGQATKANSLGVVLASDDDIQAKLGIVTETAPASDTASSGLNGRLQRIAQRLTSLIAQLPASLGVKTAANSLSITHASDDSLVTAIGATSDAAAANGAAGSMEAYLRAIKDAATDTSTPSPVSAPTLTKGTQSGNGWSVQELKDAGRSCLAMTAEFTFAQTAETLLTMTLSVDGAATSTFSSRVITSGKKFRIQSVSATVESLGSGTAPQRAYLRLRRNTAGATIASSPLQAVWGFVNSTAVVKSGFSMDYEVPDSLEMNGDGTATFGFTLETPDWVTSTATGRIKITVIGYEY